MFIKYSASNSIGFSKIIEIHVFFDNLESQKIEFFVHLIHLKMLKYELISFMHFYVGWNELLNVLYMTSSLFTRTT